jgi:hypothetical protein
MACSDQSFGPDRPLQVSLLGGLVADSITAAPADTLELTFEVLDLDGTPVSGAVARSTVEGEGAELLTGTTVTGPDGRFSVTWRMGTRASERQKLHVAVQFAARQASVELAGRLVPGEIAALDAPDSVAARLNSRSMLTVVAVDPFGNVFAPERVEYSSSDTTVFVIDSSGTIVGRSRGIARAIVRSGTHADTSTIHIFQVVGSIETMDTMALHSLGQVAALRFTIISDSGKTIRDTLPVVTLADSTIATLAGIPSDSLLQVKSRGNGTTTLTITVGSASREVTITVSQRSFSLTLTPSALPGFVALADSVQVQATAFDSLGVALASPSVTFAASDSAVVAVSSAGWVRSAGNGSAMVTAQEVTGATASLPVTVSQVADSLEVFWTDPASIKSGAQLAPPPLTCLSRDRNGYPLAVSPAVTSRTGTLFGNNCATLTVRASGYDTLTIDNGSESIQLAAVLAVRPLVSSPIGDFVSLDSFPFDYRLWAPSGRTNSQGQTEIYVTGYQYVPDSNGVGPGALHRLVSSDGITFRYDGIALDLLPPPCGLVCSGIENVAIVPRSDGPGWRMLLAAGSTGTYGWQVFSAVSPDERTWTMEPGVRISNGGPVPPAAPGVVPWPVGEGMVIDQLPGGQWRMVVGGYERVPNSPDRFEIVEYHSTDQLTWVYQGVRLTADQLPLTAQRTIYSPSIVEITPGIWRMFFTGDDLNLPGGRSRIFSAVSTDRMHWQFEAELLGGAGTDLYYTVLVGTRLYFLRQDTGQLRRLAAVTLTMP